MDIGLQTGEMNFSTTAKYRYETGVNREWAIYSVRKYPFNPGYQLCYTIGIRRFMDLFNSYGHNNLQKFVQTVLEQGEINFKDLERYFNMNHL